MSVAQAETRYTIEEYLESELVSEERREYLDGQVYLMAGESPAHGTICMNLSRIISTQLLRTPCQAFSKDTKVRSGTSSMTPKSAKGLFSYPDIVVICGEPQYYDEHRHVVINPSVIIEVLSDSTEAFDRGAKFFRYRSWNPSLTDYILVWQSEPIVEHYLRQSDGGWSIYVYESIEDSVFIKSINCNLRLAEVYDRVVFPAESED
ncbi:MAG: Uma2 family endonuclease [Acidobacteriota bacterium]